MEVTSGKLFSLAIALVYVVLLIVNQGGKAAFEGCAILLLPLALIWFPEELGSLMGSVGGGNINTETPPILVSSFGWFLLVGMPLILYFIWRSSV